MIQMPRGTKEVETLHKQILVDGLMVDEEIGWLLRSLWRRGFATNLSCQGDERRAGYVQFTTLGQGARFLDGTVDRMRCQGATADEVDVLGLRLSPTPVENDRIGSIVRFSNRQVRRVSELWTC